MDQGVRQIDAVRIFHVSKTSVHQWVRTYQADGLTALKAHQVGRPARASGETPCGDCDAADQRLHARPNEDAPCPLDASGGSGIDRPVDGASGVSLDGRRVSQALRLHAPEAAVTGLRARFCGGAALAGPGLPRHRCPSPREQVQIHSGDEMGLRSDHQATTSYGIKGRTPVIPGTGQRFVCNMIWIITNRGRLSFMVFKQRFT